MNEATCWGGGRKDRHVVLSSNLLELRRACWRAARPPGWLFPGQNRVNPLTTRRLNRRRFLAGLQADGRA
jgi:hypothetical protein